MPVLKIKQNGEWVDIAGGGASGGDPNAVTIDLENVNSGVASPVNADTLGGKPASAFAKQEDLDATLNSIKPENIGAIRMELLWENASPASSFEAKTISLGVDIPEQFMVIFRITTAGSSCVGSPIFSGRGVGYYALAMNSNGLLVSRQFVANDNGNMQFFAGKTYSTYGTAAENNAYMIPYKIYGIKGVS